MFSVAIDGPAGAGKSTLAKAAAAKLGFIYIDTGALYRTVTYAVKAAGVDIEDESAFKRLLASIKIELEFIDGVQHVFLNGQDVSELIRTPEISAFVSVVSAVPMCREFFLDFQRSLADKYNAIMDGRDIGTVVLPNAKVKIFLTASPEVRADRRYKELLEKGHEVTYEEVLDSVIKRDNRDSNRETAPLKPADDAVLLDTSNLNFDESLEEIIKLIRG